MTHAMKGHTGALLTSSSNAFVRSEHVTIHGLGYSWCNSSDSMLHYLNCCSIIAPSRE